MSVTDDKAAITSVLRQYEKALNASSTSGCVKLYAPDGVFMAQHFHTANGTEAVTEAYNQTFAMITLTVEFDIIEVVPISSDWAFARTASAGSVKMTNGNSSKEANQELFVMKRVESEWKIARYCFCTTNPPH